MLKPEERPLTLNGCSKKIMTSIFMRKCLRSGSVMISRSSLTENNHLYSFEKQLYPDF